MQDLIFRYAEDYADACSDGAEYGQLQAVTALTAICETLQRLGKQDVWDEARIVSRWYRFNFSSANIRATEGIDRATVLARGW